MLVFVSRAQREFQDFKQGSFKVMTGQIIGFSLVIFVSVTASMFGLLVPEEYMDLIGFFPLVIGIYKYWELCFHSGNSISDSKRIIGNKSFGKMGESTSKVLYTELMEDDIDFSYEEACNSSSTKAIRSYHNPSLVLLPEKKYEYQDLLQVMNSSELGSGDSGVEIFDDEDDEIDDDETFLLAYEEKKKRSVFLTGVKNMVDVCLDPFVLEVRMHVYVCACMLVCMYTHMYGCAFACIFILPHSGIILFLILCLKKMRQILPNKSTMNLNAIS
jgi:hypothetical protein